MYILLASWSSFETEMEGAVVMMLSHFSCCFSWGVLLTVAQTLLWDVAWFGVAQEIGFT